MANIVFANNAVSTIRNALGISQTTLVVAVGTGELFPAPTGGDYFKLTIEDRRTLQIEIVHCVGRSGDTLTIQRAKEDTTAKAFAIGATVANRFTRDTPDAILDQMPSPNPLYLGAFATDPTTDNDGGLLITGQTYFNTAITRLKFYTGGSWVDPYSTAILTTASGTFLLQDFSGSFNGVTTDFNLRYTDYSAATQVPDVTIAEQFLITLDGVIQKAGLDYTIPVLGTIRFTVAPIVGVAFWGVWVAVTGGGQKGDKGDKGDPGIPGPSGSGIGDMLKSTYDTNDDGIVGHAALADAAPYAGITGKPATFAPSAHTHPQSEITSLVSDLAGKSAVGHTHPQSDIANLASDLALKAPLDSPALTGNPTTPTPTAGDNDTSIASTAFVKAAIDVVKGGASAAADTLGEIETTLATKALGATTISAGTGLTGGGDLSGNRTLAVDISDQATAEAAANNTKVMTPLRVAQETAALLRVSSFLRDTIDGLILSNNVSDALNDIDVGPGIGMSDTFDYLMVLAASITKRLDAVWAVGTNQGGLDTGTEAASTWYHVWLIARPDTGVVDVLFSTSATAPTMPTNYTKKRRIGAVYNTSTSAIRAFTQYGDEFLWLTFNKDADVASPGTSAVSRVVLTPLGIKTGAILKAGVYPGTGTGNSYSYLVTSLDCTDENPTSPGSSFTVPATAQAQGGNLFWVWAEIIIRTNTSSQVRTRLTNSGAGEHIGLATRGWIDPRGRTL